ncbi:hypothetical protein GCM10023226_33210 [Nocardioides nanhaiensis]|uniref:Uncharacterized protein n=1 Tax=Nocardioides nanhaiensis TaxID=1476871 RepID=A0ABP8WQX3_9ACTN
MTTSLTGLVPGAAHAAAPGSNAPPTPVDDQVEVFPGGRAEVDLLANDTDPDGDDLAVCRLGAVPSGLLVGDGYDLDPDDAPFVSEDGTLDVAVPRGTRARTFRLTYYVCDFEHVVPATLLVQVGERPEITVRAVRGKPGVLRVTNPSEFRMQFYAVSRDPLRFLKRKALRPGSTVSVRVHYRTISWVVGSNKLGLVDRGRVEDTGWRGDPRGGSGSAAAPRWAVARG